MELTHGQRIKKRRKKLKISSSEFATRCYISQNYLSLIENDKRIPSGKTLEIIEKELRILERNNIKRDWCLCKCPEAYYLTIDRPGRDIWIKLDNEKANEVLELGNVEVIEIPF